ncbi:MAG: proton-conducting transporter membrane subunit [Anaerolineales bacterium]|nr:proton-conducting transporter membrane subunit [Anaerolineales bacterium]
MIAPAFIWMIVIPLLGAPLVYLVGHSGRRFWGDRVSRYAALLVFGATWVAFVRAAQAASMEPTADFTWGGMSLALDGISLLLAFVALLLGTFVASFSGEYITGEAGQEKFYAMLVAIVGVMIGLGCATDLFNIWIWFEAMAVTSYLLVAYYHTRALSLEAGFKYLMQSAAGSVLVLFAIGIVLSQTGTLTLAEIRSQFTAGAPMLLAGVLFLVGYGVKSALVPLHTWLPDAHSQAPSGISAMLSGVVIEAGLVALLRSIAPIAAQMTFWGPLLITCGLLNMIGGNLMAYAQTQVKRMLAYSSITHVGYMLVGLGVTFLLRESSGAQGGLFHLLNHGLMKGLAFLAAGALLYTLHSASGDHKPLMIADLAGGARRYPLAALCLSLALLSLAGLPPFAGFMSKWLIFKAGFASGDPLLWIVVALVALNSVFSLAYYAPVVNLLYRRKPSKVVLEGRPLPWSMVTPLVILSLAIIALGIWPDMIGWMTHSAGEALVAGFHF